MPPPQKTLPLTPARLPQNKQPTDLEQEASAEPGATIAYGEGHPTPQAGAPLSVPPEARNLLVSQAAGNPGKIDVVGGVTLHSGAEIRTGSRHGMGASAGPVHVEGGKVVASAAQDEAGGGAAAGKGEGGDG